MTKEQELQRAREAEQLLGNTLLQEAFEVMEAAFSEKWKQTPIGQVESREKLYMMTVCLRELKSVLTQWISRGKVVVAESAQAKARAEREAEMRGWDGSPESVQRLP